MKLAIAAAVVAIARIAYADTAPAKPAEPAKPDEIADTESTEANLEPHEPRNGFTFTVAALGDFLLGNGVGRGLAPSFRLGHVATRKTVITFELTFPNSVHRATGLNMESGPTLVDSNTCLFAGAQRYKGQKWARLAGGLTILTKNARADGSDSGDKPIAGVGTIVGFGADLVRLGYPWLGVEAMFMGSLSRDGVKVSFGAGLGVMFP